MSDQSLLRENENGNENGNGNENENEKLLNNNNLSSDILQTNTSDTNTSDTNTQPFEINLVKSPTISQPTISQNFPSTISQPTISQPTISQPTISQPIISQPTISQPTISQPTISQPTISQPTISQDEDELTPEQQKELNAFMNKLDNKYKRRLASYKFKNRSLVNKYFTRDTYEQEVIDGNDILRTVNEDLSNSYHDVLKYDDNKLKKEVDDIIEKKGGHFSQFRHAYFHFGLMIVFILILILLVNFVKIPQDKLVFLIVPYMFIMAYGIWHLIYDIIGICAWFQV